MTGFYEFIDTAFLAADTGPDAVYFSGEGFVRPLWVSQQRPSQHDHVTALFAQSAFRYVRIAQFPDRYDGHRYAGIAQDISVSKVLLRHRCDIQETSRRHA